MRLRPLNSNVHVRFVKEDEQTAGGIYLPETCRDNWQTGVVLATGDGYPLPDSALRSVMYTYEGETVLFFQHDLALLSRGSDEAVVAEEKLVAVHDEDVDALVPLNDWVALDVIDKEELYEASSLIIPDEFRTRINLGRITDFGPGFLRLNGHYFGSRKSVPGIMGLTSNQTYGALVYWTDDAECLELGRDGIEAVFVRAGDLAILKVGDDNGEA
jgi:chaperonin GroES